MSPFGYESSEREARKVSVRGKPNPHKLFVKVRADHDTDGSIRPLSFVTPEGENVMIDRVRQVKQAASLKAGGQGLRYDVFVTCGDVSRELYLFDDDGVWFIEKD